MNYTQTNDLVAAAAELILQAERSLDYRPEFRKAISEVRDLIDEVTAKKRNN